MAAAKKRSRSEIVDGHPKPLHFAKVILEDTLESGKLRLPKRFCRNHEKDLLNLNNVASLKVPNSSGGDVWEVTLTKCRNNGEFWFEKGWKEFACFNSIKLGGFVVFKWEVEKSEFQVIIFDKTMTEVQYPSKCIPPVKLVQLISEDEEDDDVPVKIMSSPLSLMESMKRSSICEASSSKHGNSQTEHALNRRLHDRSSGKLDFSESIAAQQGSGFVSEYPFFQMVIGRSCLIPGIMSVPLSFAKSNINWNCSKQILTFVTNGGRSWHVKLSCNPESKKSNVYGGLSSFFKENFVREGNLCTFELIDKKQMVFRVYIHRSKDKISHADSKRPCSSKMANVADMHGKLDFSEFAANYPFFQATISKTTLFYKRLTVPQTFLKDNNVNTESDIHQIVTLETAGGRSWPVKLVTYSNPKHQSRLFGGLKAFLKENNLKEGDICTLELVSRKSNMVFKVSIDRG